MSLLLIIKSVLILSTPAQNFLLILDTGSSDMWVADMDCTTSTCSDLERFDTASSSTYEASSTPFRISYGSGDAAGLITRDTVTMGGFTIQNQGFGEFTTKRLGSTFSYCQPNYLRSSIGPYLRIDGSRMGEYSTNWRHPLLASFGRIRNMDNAGDGCLHEAIS